MVWFHFVCFEDGRSLYSKHILVIDAVKSKHYSIIVVVLRLYLSYSTKSDNNNLSGFIGTHDTLEHTCEYMEEKQDTHTHAHAGLRSQ